MYIYAYVCMWPQVLSAAWAEEWALNTQAPFLNLTAALAQVRTSAALLDTQTCVHTQHINVNIRVCYTCVRARNRFHVSKKIRLIVFFSRVSDTQAHSAHAD